MQSHTYERFSASQRADAAMKGFSAFLDMMKCKEWDHEINSWNSLSKDLFHQFPKSTECLSPHPEFPTAGVGGWHCSTGFNPAKPPGSSAHGILQTRILEWVAISFSRGSTWPRDWTRVSCIVGRFFTDWATREAPSETYDLTTMVTLYLNV